MSVSNTCWWKVLIPQVWRKRSWKCESSYIKDWTDNNINKTSLIYSCTQAKYIFLLYANYLCWYTYCFISWTYVSKMLWYLGWSVPGLIDFFIMLEFPVLAIYGWSDMPVRWHCIMLPWWCKLSLCSLRSQMHLAQGCSSWGESSQ